MNFEEWYAKTTKESSEFDCFCFDAKTGWDACKDEILKILTTPIQNADLSWEHVDSRFIEEIKKL